MKNQSEIQSILKKISSKNRYQQVDFDKLDNIFASVELKTPEFDPRVELNRLRDRLPDAMGKLKYRKEGFRALEWLSTLSLPPRMVLVPVVTSFVMIFALTFVFRNNIFENQLVPDDTGSAACTLSYGDVTIVRGSDRIPAVQGMEIHPKDTIVVGKNSLADFVFENRLRLRLKENSRFALSRLMNSKTKTMHFKSELMHGTMFIKFSKLSGNDHASVAAPGSVAIIRGTSFGVSIDNKKKVTYDVFHGAVKVKNRLSIIEDPIIRENLSKLDELFDERSVILSSQERCVIDASKYPKILQAIVDNIRRTGSSFDAAAIEKLRQSISKPKKQASDSLNMDNESREFARNPIHDKAREKSAVLRINTVPEYALVSLDGEKKGKGSRFLIANAGSHVLTVSAEGYEPRKMNVEVKLSGSDVVVQLKKIAGAEFDISKWQSDTTASHLAVLPRQRIMLSVNRHGMVEAVSRKGYSWKHDFGAQLNSYPVWDRNSLYVVTDNEKILTISLKTGKLQWSQPVEGVLHFGSRMVVDAKNVYIGTSKGYVYSFSKKGKMLWKKRLASGIYATPAKNGSLLFVPTHDGDIYGLDARTGDVKYKKNIGRVIGSALVARNGKIIASTFQGDVVCYDFRSNKINWKYNINDKIIVDSIIYKNQLYVSGVNGIITRLDLSGNMKWVLDVGNKIHKSPVITGKGVYLLAEKALYVIDTVTGSTEWSYVIPSNGISNIVLSQRFMYFGTEKNGIIKLKK